MSVESRLISVNIEDEMKKSYLDYAMSVIVGRALPDIRDGLKPVHRRVLFGMHDLKNYHNRPYKKSARIVGDVIGKYHPHGDVAVYDTIVRMAQDFSMRYPLVDGQGNFGSIDGDPPAAMRYTEVRMTQLAQYFLSDLEKETVNFVANYDGSLQEPVVLPTTIPNLLINGSAGIAVGMATNIPPHNLSEVCDAISYLIDHPDCPISELMGIIKGPDFPTAGFIVGTRGIREAYETGRGIIRLRARAFVEPASQQRERIIISEIPYQLNKTKLLEKIGELVREKTIEEISEVRDESDRDGMRIVIDVKRDGKAPVILNRLYKFTQMETSFGIILLAIVNGRPQVLNLKEILEHFISHRREIIVRRTIFDLKKAEERAHILEGLKKALDFLDEVIELIRGSSDPKEARSNLISSFDFSEIQAQAILDMRLQRLTGLEREKIDSEYRDLIKDIARFKAILESPKMVLEIIKEEILEVKNAYGDPRRTEIIPEEGEVVLEDLIAEEDMVVTVSHEGYIKRNPASLYRAQRRGGKGMTGAKTKEDDFIEHLFVASSHDYFLFFTSRGRLYCKKVHEIPEGSRTSRGKAIVNLLDLQTDEKVATILSVRSFEEGSYLIMATKNGVVKKTPLVSYSRPRSAGLAAITIREEDELVGTRVTNGSQNIFLTTKNGMSIRFPEEDVRPTGRGAMGIRGIRLYEGDEVVSMEALSEGAILTVTENGYGKRTATGEYRRQTRGGKGVRTIKTSERNGKVVYAYQVTDQDQLMIMTEQGKIIRVRIEDISVIGRNTQGVRLINLSEGEKVVAVAKVVEESSAL
ncbi:MAG: DNA gyrase subunit A [Deltaproteobacteria bacterium CG_4_8_14_3_um_filter_51_11]|nr:DNA gyrase subunit A [bacterium]OIP41429.1 MAG: DNA gyrase subunit A [Desulfobacteraceae bacterium CG2_30_51_40]PIP46701.1 MAG: DNA gyrase subunit A [Deltaproteobacteria bacterium CG23_combo_of_CG06-09_8_20_14_all_51_20]PIX20504.1 MAG: DNA gyrase subunit A [Deltaproteobacteria bacterium CG_4_8_14_3_um_filter_51_11]